MKYSITNDSLEKIHSGCLILGFFENKKLAPSTAVINKSCKNIISSILKRDGIKGKIGDTLLLNHVPDSSADRFLLVGLGKNKELEDKGFRKVLSAVVKAIKQSQIKEAVSTLAEIEVKERDVQWKIRQTIELFENGLYKFTQLKSEANQNTGISELQFFVADDSLHDLVINGMKQGQAIAEGVDLAKEVSNLPGNICTPEYLAKQAQKLGKKNKKLKVKVLEEADMEKLGMGALLSVSKGSRQPAKLITIEYSGSSKKTSPIVLVGKGLTFDAGGISLKPAAAMDEMKYDMCGGASVLGTMAVVSALNLPLNVVGIIPSSENLPDGNANKPGDIVTSMAGKTIEILNTDAEGRLILCDALTYAKRYEPKIVIDIATLTGACVIALGHHPSGLLGNDDELCDALVNAGKTACDQVWRLPLWDEYQDQLKSNFADIANIGGRDGGTITAACFLSRFTEKYCWAHLDIAGTAWKSGQAKGATGRPVPLLSQYLLDQV